MPSSDTTNFLSYFFDDVSKVNTIEEAAQDPFIRDILPWSRDPMTGMTLTFSPPPVVTDYLKSVRFELGFPPRFGAHNEEIYGKTLGYSASRLRDFKARQII